MKRIIASLLLAFSIAGTAQAKCFCHPDDYAFYLKVGSGVSFPESLKVTAPSDTWTEVIQGYNSKLGNRGIAEFSIGCEYGQFVDLEVGISNRSTFKYRKLQTPLGGDFSFTREFDLDVTTALFSLNVLFRDISCLNWDIACGTVYPIFGAGVGVSNLKITNFRTTGLPPSGASFPYASFASENQYTHHRNFTYTLQLGLEYNYQDKYAISTGYRYFDAGKFKGPRYIRVDTGAAVDVGDNEWKMRFRANEWFIEFSLYL